MNAPVKRHVFWCGQGYQPTADCTCYTPLRMCRCEHDESRHYHGKSSCAACKCIHFIHYPVRVAQ